MVTEGNKNIWVIIETKNGIPVKSSFEALSAAKLIAGEKGEKAVAIVFKAGGDEVLKEISGFGADSIISVGSDIKEYDIAAAASALEELLKEYKPFAVIAMGTSFGKELLACLSVKLCCLLVSDAVKLSLNEGNILWTCPAYSGNIFYDCVIEGNFPKIGTIQKGAFKKLNFDPEKRANITEEKTDICGTKGFALVESVNEITEAVNLEDAVTIVSGGRGMGSKENFEMLYELAALFGGAVGATRAPIESGWIPRSHQIGQSGKIVKPRLYIACGMSGAIQHVSGMRDSDFIFSINKDEEAAIFDVSNVGIVGNVNNILPVLIKEIKNIKT
ncbi:MAG: electron transfer flavoprotein subunit alpha/FixB family protein [Lachnospiraceae bacterium]|nr:electron transfer flavoprotein subunit alpha/FixB family protein [Lachnospiraceae bacterium]